MIAAKVREMSATFESDFDDDPDSIAEYNKFLLVNENFYELIPEITITVQAGNPLHNALQGAFYNGSLVWFEINA